MPKTPPINLAHLAHSWILLLKLHKTCFCGGGRGLISQLIQEFLEKLFTNRF